MTRQYGRLMLTVWEDKEYQSLTLAQQGMFCSLLAYPGISWCGVIDFIPKRLVKISDSLTADELVKHLNALGKAAFLVPDSDTDELLVRRFIHYDGIMKMPNVAKAMAKAIDKVQSPLIRDVVIAELARLRIERPDLNGWNGLSEGFGDLLDEVDSATDQWVTPADPSVGF